MTSNGKLQHEIYTTTFDRLKSIVDSQTAYTREEKMEAVRLLIDLYRAVGQYPIEPDVRRRGAPD